MTYHEIQTKIRRLIREGSQEDLNKAFIENKTFIAAEQSFDNELTIKNETFSQDRQVIFSEYVQQLTFNCCTFTRPFNIVDSNFSKVTFIDCGFGNDVVISLIESSISELLSIQPGQGRNKSLLNLKIQNKNRKVIKNIEFHDHDLGSLYLDGIKNHKLNVSGSVLSVKNISILNSEMEGDITSLLNITNSSENIEVKGSTFKEKIVLQSQFQGPIKIKSSTLKSGLKADGATFHKAINLDDIGVGLGPESSISFNGAKFNDLVEINKIKPVDNETENNKEGVWLIFVNASIQKLNIKSSSFNEVDLTNCISHVIEMYDVHVTKKINFSVLDKHRLIQNIKITDSILGDVLFDARHIQNDFVFEKTPCNSFTARSVEFKGYTSFIRSQIKDVPDFSNAKFYFDTCFDGFKVQNRTSKDQGKLRYLKNKMKEYDNTHAAHMFAAMEQECRALNLTNAELLDSLVAIFHKWMNRFGQNIYQPIFWMIILVVLGTVLFYPDNFRVKEVTGSSFKSNLFSENQWAISAMSSWLNGFIDTRITIFIYQQMPNFIISIIQTLTPLRIIWGSIPIEWNGFGAFYSAIHNSLSIMLWYHLIIGIQRRFNTKN